MEIRFDWLTFTLPIQEDTNAELLCTDLFNIPFESFVACKGRFGYRLGAFYENITVLQEGGLPEMGICFDISGQGCTYLYAHGVKFEDLFTYINSVGGNITRLDIALDCYDNEVDLDVMLDCVKVHNYSSRWHKVQYTCSRNPHVSDDFGIDIQFGSRSSDIMLRIYDKKVQTGTNDRPYWVRFEFQCRNHLAYAFADTYMQLCVDQDQPFVDLFRGILQHYLRFIDRKYKNDPDKCPTLPWWESFMEDVAKS